MTKARNSTGHSVEEIVFGNRRDLRSRITCVCTWQAGFPDPEALELAFARHRAEAGFAPPAWRGKKRREFAGSFNPHKRRTT